MIARAFWKLRQFSKLVIFKNAQAFWSYRSGSKQRPHALQVASLPIELSWFNVHSLKIGLFVSIYLIFNPWWMFSPCEMLMCTNKTCFAGVGTRPKTIFWIRICFLSYPCESKKIKIFLSADQTSILGVDQVFPVLEWNLIFVMLSKILDRLISLFICSTNSLSHCLSRDAEHTVYREMRNIHL